MLKVVPTEIHPTQATQHQRYDVRFANLRLRLMVAASFERQMETPCIQCKVTSDLTQVRFRCGYCNCYHYHGNVPKHSPLKGHRVEHCHSDPNPYPNGYYLRTDLDKITSERFPNFAVVANRDIKGYNAHFRKCRRLSMIASWLKTKSGASLRFFGFMSTTSIQRHLC